MHIAIFDPAITLYQILQRCIAVFGQILHCLFSKEILSSSDNPVAHPCQAAHCQSTEISTTTETKRET